MTAPGKAAAQALSARLAKVAEVTPHAVAICDPAGLVTWINPGFSAITGDSCADSVGRALSEILGCGEDSAAETLRRAMNIGAGLRLEIQSRATTGRLYRLDLDVQPTFHDDGAPDGFIAIGVEATRAHETQARLTAANAALRSAGQLARIGGWSIDLKANRVALTTELREMMGRTALDEDAEDALLAYVPEDRERVRAEVGRVILNGGRLDFEAQGFTGSGELMHLRVLGEAEMVDGRCVAIRGATQDISGQRAAMAELRESERFARGVIDGVGAMLVVIDEGGAIIEANRSFRARGAELQGSATYTLGGNLFDVLERLPRGQGRRLTKGLRAVLDGEAETFNLAYESRYDGWFRLTAARFAGKGPVRCVVFTQSIADLKASEGRLRQANASLKKARDAANAANAAKSAFLATMSHEIRTPLNGVLGMAQAMANEDLPPVQRERLGVIRQSGETLLVLLNDLLDLSRIESGRMELEDGVVDIEALVAGVQATFQALAEAKGVAFVTSISQSALGRWRGDPARVRQILANLVSNAVKFTDQGRITIAVSHAAGGLTLSVTDTGHGVPADRLSLLFDKFVQADASTTRQHGGSGLGLAICRDLATLMGGDVEARSVVGEGSTFTLRVPMKRLKARAAVAPATPVEPVHDLRPLKVLAADDNPMNQLVLTTLLSQLGMQVTAVGDGRQAVDAVADGGWDLVLMDVQMPRLDGLGATRLIRADELAGGKPRLPIIALTANAMDHHRAEYLACGMDAVVSKPIELARLLAAIEEVCRPPQAQTASRTG